MCAECVKNNVAIALTGENPRDEVGALVLMSILPADVKNKVAFHLNGNLSVKRIVTTVKTLLPDSSDRRVRVAMVAEGDVKSNNNSIYAMAAAHKINQRETAILPASAHTSICCFRCGRSGHLRHNCTITCCRCGHQGHVQKNCQGSPLKLFRGGTGRACCPQPARMLVLKLQVGTDVARELVDTGSSLTLVS